MKIIHNYSQYNHVIVTFRLSGSSVLPAYPGFIVMNTAHDAFSVISTPSNMNFCNCKDGMCICIVMIAALTYMIIQQLDDIKIL